MQQSVRSSLKANSDASSSRKRSLADYELVNVAGKNTPELGKGAFGEVRLARAKDDGKLYAIKSINKQNLKQFSTVEHLKREIKIQKKLDHPHILRLYHSFEDSDCVHLVLEYAENGALFYYLHKKKKINEQEAFVYFFQSCIGIDYLHKKNIIHRDLKV